MHREVKCPHCGQLAIYGPQNPYRPFCSERCQLIDLGDWADGKYAIPVQEDKPSSSETKEKGSNEDDVD
jgi:uncharacterized protein